MEQKLGGGFKHFLFSSLLGEKIPILTNIFQRGWNHQLEKVAFWIWNMFAPQVQALPPLRPKGLPKSTQPGSRGSWFR